MTSSRVLVLVPLLLAAVVSRAQLTPATDQVTVRAPVPIEDFTRFSEINGIRLSPGGDYVAYMSGDYGRSMLLIQSLQTRQITGGARCPDGFEISGFRWASATRLVYQLAERQPGLEVPAQTGEIFAMDFDGKRQTAVYGYRVGSRQTGQLVSQRKSTYAFAQIISTLPDDDRNILILERPWKLTGDTFASDFSEVALLDIVNGDKKSLGRVPLARANVLTDRNHQVRFAVGQYKDARAAVIWKPQAAETWREFVLPGFRMDQFEPVAFSPDNQSLYFLGVRNGESLNALYKMAIATLSPEKLFGSDTVDVLGLVYGIDGESIVGVEYAAGKPAIHWIDKSDTAATVIRSLSKALPDQYLEIVSATRDGKFALVLARSDTNPGDYYFFDVQAMKANFLYPARSWIDPARMRPMEPVSLTARDGVRLYGYLTRAAGNGPQPLIILPHGGPHGVFDTWGFDWEVQLLASRGYSVLQVNFRGSGGYGIEFLESGYRQWGAAMQDDLTDATRWAIEQKVASADQICIYGASYGGFAALSGVVREPKLYRCAIGYVGVYDLELMKTSGDIPDSRYGMAYLKKALGDDVESLRARSPARHVDRIEAPVFIIHGKADWRAAFDQAQFLKRQMDANKKPYEWLALSREGHGVYNEATRKEVYERILAFLDRHLKQ